MTERQAPEVYAERFWLRVAVAGPTDCWPYSGPAFADGYGRHYRPETQSCDRAHRVAWRLASRSEIPPGMFVCHTCDNPPCVNPAHLFLGTHRDNTDDMHAKGRCRNHRQLGGPVHRIGPVTRRSAKGLPFFFAGIAARLDRTTGDAA